MNTNPFPVPKRANAILIIFYAAVNIKKEVVRMPVMKRPLNPLGRWVCQELDARNIQRSTFAEMVGTTPQNLSDVMRGTDLSVKAMQKWELRFREALKQESSGSSLA